MPSSAIDIFRAGGPVMWPLLAMSLVALTLVIERGLYWLRAEGRSARRALSEFSASLASFDGSPRVPAGLTPPYHGVAGTLAHAFERGRRTSELEALAAQAIEAERPRIERFNATLSTIITAAPMLGILGTVTGIIASFKVLSDTTLRDPTAVAGGIAEALITTAFGLIVALLALFPYMAFRARVERCYSRLETLVDLALVAAGADPADAVRAAPGERDGVAGRTMAADASRLPRATRLPEESPSTAGQGGG